MQKRSNPRKTKNASVDRVLLYIVTSLLLAVPLSFVVIVILMEAIDTVLHTIGRR
jgi:hypothetical protein